MNPKTVDLVRLPSGVLVPRELLRTESEIRGFGRDIVKFASSMAAWEWEPWQLEVIRSQRRRMLLLCSRQAGKSSCAAILALHTALFKPRSLTVMIAPSQRQSRELFRKTQTSWDLLLEWGKARGLPYIGPELDEDNSLSLGFSNGSRIVALPANATTVRGFSAVDLYIEDESAFVPEDLHEAVSPMLAVSRGRVVLLSTPHGKRGHFYKIWSADQKKLQLEARWHRVKVLATQCPHIPASAIQEALRDFGQSYVDQEYMCEFRDLQSQVFTEEDLLRAQSEKVYPLLESAADVDPVAEQADPWEQED